MKIGIRRGKAIPNAPKFRVYEIAPEGARLQGLEGRSYGLGDDIDHRDDHHVFTAHHPGVESWASARPQALPN